MGIKPLTKSSNLESGDGAPKVQKSETNDQVIEKLTPEQIAAAKAAFKKYDKDGR
jgi:hypothetical protein